MSSTSLPTSTQDKRTNLRQQYSPGTKRKGFLKGRTVKKAAPAQPQDSVSMLKASAKNIFSQPKNLTADDKRAAPAEAKQEEKPRAPEHFTVDFPAPTKLAEEKPAAPKGRRQDPVKRFFPIAPPPASVAPPQGASDDSVTPPPASFPPLSGAE